MRILLYTEKQNTSTSSKKHNNIEYHTSCDMNMEYHTNITHHNNTATIMVALLLWRVILILYLTLGTRFLAGSVQHHNMP